LTEEEIELEDFYELTDHTIAKIFPKDVPRSRFEKKYKQFMKTVKGSSVVEVRGSITSYPKFYVCPSHFTYYA